VTDLHLIERRIAGSKALVIDTETNGLDWRRNQTVGYVLTFGPAPDESLYLPIRHEGGGNLDPDKTLSMIRGALSIRHDLRIVGFNLGFDLKMMEGDRVRVPGPLEDASINAFLIDERQPKFSLDSCCKFMGVQEKKGDAMYAHLAAKFGGKAEKSQMANFYKLAGDDPVAVDYATGDGTSTWQLWQKQQQSLDDQDLRRVWDVECRVIRVLHRMMVRGIRIDEERLQQVMRVIDRRLEAARAALPKDFNEKAPSQLKKLFTDSGHTDWPLTPKGNPSFAEEWLETNPIGQKVVAVRKLSHLKEAFLVPMLERHLFKGRVHTNFNQTRGEQFGTITGRLSSNEPNLQQVPKRDELLGSVFRSIFIPDEGKVWSSRDYNQVEPRLLAHYGKVRILIDGYFADPPIDAHKAVALAAGIERQAGKTLNQALLTGAGRAKATLMLGMPPAEARKVVDAYFASMPEIQPFQRRASDVWIARGYLRSVLGRRARLEDVRHSYKAVNRILQLGNADIIKKAMADVDEYYASEGDRVHLLNNIHDDLCDQFHPDDRAVHDRATELMEDFGPGRSVPLDVPLRVDDGQGPDWAVATYGLDTVREAWQTMGDIWDRPTGPGKPKPRAAKGRTKAA
jgi:DNA polymerase-1